MTIIRLIHAGICAAIGYSAFIAFIILKNYPSAVLGLISGITDSILVFLHYLDRIGKLRQWYDQTHLRIICRYGIIVATTGLLCLGYFTTIQIMYKKPIMPIPGSSAIGIVWSIVVLRSGIFLMGYSICYQQNEETRLLIEPVRNDVEVGQEQSSPISDSAVPEQL